MSNSNKIKIRCTRSKGDSSAWRFTEGCEYKVNGDFPQNCYVIDNNGICLWLFSYDGVIRGAGIDGFEFEEVTK